MEPSLFLHDQSDKKTLLSLYSIAQSIIPNLSPSSFPSRVPIVLHFPTPRPSLEPAPLPSRLPSSCPSLFPTQIPTIRTLPTRFPTNAPIISNSKPLPSTPRTRTTSIQLFFIPKLTPKLSVPPSYLAPTTIATYPTKIPARLSTTSPD